MNRFKEIVQSKSLYRISFILVSFFQMVTFADGISYILTGVLFFWGVYLLIHHCIRNKGFRKIEYRQFFIVFLLLSLLTLFTNLNTGLISIAVNAVTTIVNLIFFFLFFGSHNEDINAIRREIYIISKAVMTISTVFAIIGLALLVLFHRAIWIDGRSLIIFENRFKGVFINPNPQAFACFTAIVSCIILNCKGFIKSIGKKPIRKSVLLPCMGINFICLLLSASNAGILVLSSFIFGYICYRIFSVKTVLSGRNIAIRSAVFALCCFFVVCTLLLVRTGVSNLSSVLISGEPVISSDILAPSKEQYSSELQTPDGNVTFEHINGTLDSGRIGLYKQALKTITDNPLTGVGYGSIFSYGWLEKGELFDFHNAYLTLAASNGLLAFLLIFIFGIRLAFRMCTGVFKLHSDFSYNILPCLFSFICAYCIYSLVEPTMFFYPTYMAGFFWIVLGAAFTLLRDFETREVN